MYIIFAVLLIFIVLTMYILIDDEKKENVKLDDLKFIKRNSNYNNLIGNIIDKKSILFNEKQIKSMKNPYQVYNVDGKINNITDKLNNNMVDIHINGFKGNGNNVIPSVPQHEISVPINNNQYIDVENTKILNNLSNNFPTKINCDSVSINDKRLDNYYYDLYGNRIQSTMNDYISAYNTLMDKNMGDHNDKICIPVKTLKGQSNFVIPNMYEYNSKLTDAYNIDYTRVINPLTIY
jgi:hypothetical protein